MIGRVLVTGGAGYLGRVLIKELLLYDVAVSVIDKKLGSDFGDLTEEELKKYDTIIHLAAETNVLKCQKNMNNTFRENCIKTVQLSRKIMPHRHFIFVSTSAVYGDADGEIVGWHRVNPNTFYALSKLMAEELILKGDTTIIRLATLWGKTNHMREGMFITESIREMKEYGMARVFDPTTKRPYMHVEDAAREIVDIVRQRKPGLVNLGVETLRKVDVIGLLAKHFKIETIISKETEFIQDFTMPTRYDGKKFFDCYREAF